MDIATTLSSGIGELVFGLLGMIFLISLAGFLAGVWIWSLAALARGKFWLAFALGALLPILAPFLAAIFTRKEGAASKDELLRYFAEGIISALAITFLGWPLGVIPVVLFALYEAGVIGRRESERLAEIDNDSPQAKKASAKKPATKKPAAKKTSNKKPAAKKTQAKKPVAKKKKS